MGLVCSKWIFFFIQNRTLRGLEEAEKHWDLSECGMEEVEREREGYARRVREIWLWLRKNYST